MNEPTTNTPAEHAANMVVKNNAVPEKFVNADGSTNVEGLVESYRALENKMSAPAPTDAPPQAVAAEAPAPVVTPVPTTPQTTMDDMLSAPEAPATPDIWARVEAESKTGNISEETIAGLRASGVPESVISNYSSGVKASAEARTTAAADAVGGVDNLQKAMDFARSNYTPEQTEALKGQLNGPLWEATLKGLAIQAGLGNPTHAQASPSTAAPAATPVTEAVMPFESQSEMTAAIRDPRYTVDTDYQRFVQARIRANAGV